MHSKMSIVLAGTPRWVCAQEQQPGRRHDSSEQRRVRIDFEVDSCDHAMLGRELHRALDGVPLRDQHGIGWQAVSMSSRLGDGELRQFTVDLLEI
jgi:hypothetical protein